MNTLSPGDEQDDLISSPEQPAVSKTMKLVIAGCIALGILDTYEDYYYFAQEDHIQVSHSSK